MISLLKDLKIVLPHWFRTYLTGWEYFLALGNHRSKDFCMTCGVPHGSILGPLLFSLYMLSLGSAIWRHNINYHSYADDRQLYISVTPNNYSSIDCLVNCMADGCHRTFSSSTKIKPRY